jgi:hypothetical protein
MQGGPVVNNVRLALTPSTLELRPGESKVFGIHLANRTELDIRIVTGVSTRGDNVSASAAYEIQKVLEGAELGDKPTARLSPVLRTTLPKDYGVSAESNSPLPLLKKIPSFATLDIGVEVNLQSVALGDGKKEMARKRRGYSVSRRATWKCQDPELILCACALIARDRAPTNPGWLNRITGPADSCSPTTSS